MDFDLVIHDGTLVTAADTVQADLGIQGETISAIGQNLRGRGRGGVTPPLLDARGKLVLPGAIDPHVHLEMATPVTTSSDDFETGTIAAACGGTTTVIDFVESKPGEQLLDALHARRARAEGRAVIDFGLHMTLSDADPSVLAQVPEITAAGISSFKTYTTYKGLRLDDAAMLEVMQAVARAGGLVIVHAENDAIVEWLKRKLVQAGNTMPRYHPRSRPAAAEGEAVERVLALGDVVGAPIYIVHVSTARGAGAIGRARSRGQAAFGETCPQYLLLTDAEYERPDFEGAKYVCSPPLRRSEDNAALWDALARGELQTVGTDHCSFNFRGQKEIGREKFTDIPGGLPGIEARLALLYTFGVREKRLTLNQWVGVCCTAPAQLFGVYPRKGTLMPGADADIIIFDPEKEVTLSRKTLHENVDYTPYEGVKLKGYPATVISRGEVVVKNSKFVGTKGRGRYLKRERRIMGVACTSAVSRCGER